MLCGFRLNAIPIFLILINKPAASIEDNYREKKRTLENSEVHCRIYKKSLKKGYNNLGRNVFKIL